jgi:hypothetical protein
MRSRGLRSREVQILGSEILEGSRYLGVGYILGSEILEIQILGIHDG